MLITLPLRASRKKIISESYSDDGVDHIERDDTPSEEDKYSPFMHSCIWKRTGSKARSGFLIIEKKIFERAKPSNTSIEPPGSKKE